MHNIAEISAGFAGGVVATVFFQSLVKRAFEDVIVDYERAKARLQSVKKTAEGK